MASLSKWSFNYYKKDYFYLTGIINGHSHIKDGVHIRTSKIVDIRREEAFLIANTENTQYYLHLSEANQREEELFKNYSMKSTKDIAEVYEKSADEKMVHFIRYYILLNTIIAKETLNIQKSINSGTIIDIQELIKKYSEKLKKSYEADEIIDKDLKHLTHLKIKHIKKITDNIHINNNELYLDIDDRKEGLFKKAVTKDDNANIYLIESPIIHLGMFQDSVLLPRNICPHDFRYFPIFNRLEIYCWDERLERAFFYNSGVSSLEIIHKDRKMTVAPQETSSLKKS